MENNSIPQQPYYPPLHNQSPNHWKTFTIVLLVVIIGGIALWLFKSQMQPIQVQNISQEKTPIRNNTSKPISTSPFNNPLNQNTKTTTKQNYSIAYGLYSENENKYKIYIVDLANNDKKTIYAIDWKKNFRAPSIEKYDNNTIMVSEGINKGSLINLNGNRVEGKFIPPSTAYSFSPNQSKLLYHSYLPPTGITTITIRDYLTGKEFFVKTNGEGKYSNCDNAIWKQDNSIVYCNNETNMLAINTSIGSFTTLDVKPGFFYPDDDLIFRTEASQGEGDSIPPSSLVMVNTKTYEEKTLVKNEDKLLNFSTLLPNKKQIVFSDGDIYVADIDDVAQSKRKIALQGFLPIEFADDGVNFVFRKSLTDNREPYIDGVFLTDIYGSEPVELYSTPRSFSPGSQFIGWFSK